MQRPADKLLLVGLCLLMLYFAQAQPAVVVALLAAVAVGSLCEYFENRAPKYLCAAYVVLCLFMPGFTVFLPVVAYDLAGFDKFYLRFCWIVAVGANFFASDPPVAVAAAILSGTAFLLQHRTAAQKKAREEFFALTDSAKEHSMSLEQKNRDLMEKQDYEIRLATLKERNRIAREIHDNVGHLLTRSILQLGAMQVTHSGDSGLQNEICQIKDTMSGAMDSVRVSVHELHEDSVDLKMQLETMAGGFGFCPIKLRYDATELPAAVKYCFIAIVREALSNIAKHSDATETEIAVAQHPAFCRLTVEDNGTVRAAGGSGGIGLSNMADRVEALGGVFRAGYDKGFKIFISIPNEKEKNRS